MSRLNDGSMWSEQIAELATALAKAQSQLKPAIKDSTNPFFKSKYADLAAVWDSCREALTANGLSIVQLPRCSGQVLQTVLFHSSGQWVSSMIEMHPADNKPQSMGSAITYARRFSLMAMVGIAPEDDDDGQAASHPVKEGLRVTRPPYVPGPPDTRTNFGEQAMESIIKSDEALKSPAVVLSAPLGSDGDNFPSRKPTEKQLKRLFAIASSKGIQPEDLKTYAKTSYGVESSKDLVLWQVDTIIEMMERGMFPGQKGPSEA